MEELLKKWEEFLAGDEEAFAWLYKNHTGLLYEYGMRFTADDDLVKDCIHDLFLTLYKNKGSITKPRDVKAYLLVSLKNRLLNAMKHSSFSDSVEDRDYVFNLVDSVEDEYIESETKEDIRRMVELVLSKLSPRQKEIIYYRYIQELSMTEICEIMNLSYQSAQNLIQKAFHKISTDEDIIKSKKLRAQIIILFLSFF
ncbi:MAG: sigma-70 family RNA polymerase sigma factor [Tannerella sp.]|jgi:RNA polymerase sigma factor (sigma-70 family)|nr:sigma-70 family RNA polymerase sigma factor [Tannerella sp.]